MRSARAGFVALLLLAAVWAGWRLRRPDLSYLPRRPGAQWIRLPGPADLFSHPADAHSAAFRARFRVESSARSGVLTVCALKDAAAALDRRLILPLRGDLSRWKDCREAPLENLAPGDHELSVVVANHAGPPVLWAAAPALGVATGPDWEAAVAAPDWMPAESADAFTPAPLSLMFASPARALAGKLPVLAGWVLLLAGLARAWGGRFGPDQARTLLVAAWLVLGLNNILKLPAHVGFDVKGHLDYVAALLAGRLPLAPEGVQMFQPPLFYALCAPLLALFERLTDVETAAKLLRVIPLLCGMAQVELARRAARLAFAQREDLQTLAVILGGLLPMSLYSSQAVGNEPLAGALTGALVVSGLSLLRGAFPRPRDAAALGLLLGAAMLTKATAVLMIPPLLLALWLSAGRQKIPLSGFAAAAAAFLATAFLVCGWFYLRNWSLLGRPFIGGWDVALGWWQDPGYRTAAQFLTFGEALVRPVYASTRGFWDSIYSTLWLDGQLSGRALFEYRPPWNYGFMLAGSWLALLPTLGLLAGFLRGAAAERESPLRFCAACLAMYFAALLCVYASAPMYCIAKATYTLGLLPCYAVLGAAGLGWLCRGPWAASAARAWTAAWALSAYLAYFA